MRRCSFSTPRQNEAISVRWAHFRLPDGPAFPMCCWQSPQHRCSTVGHVYPADSAEAHTGAVDAPPRSCAEATNPATRDRGVLSRRFGAPSSFVHRGGSSLFPRPFQAGGIFVLRDRSRCTGRVAGGPDGPARSGSGVQRLRPGGRGPSEQPRRRPWDRADGPECEPGPSQGD
jgi:hypothetical protein